MRGRVLLAALVIAGVPATALADETPLQDPTAETVFTFSDPEIVESSGLVIQGGFAVTVNDSGDTARLFTVDPATGDTVGVTRWPREAYDVEGLAPAGDGAVWVGDIGDNFKARETIRLHRVPIGRGERTAVEASYELAYPDGRHDAETLLRHPGTGRLYVVSKEAVAGRVYAVPREPSTSGVNRLRGVGRVMGVATGGEFFPDGRHLLIRGYARATVYTWPGLAVVAEFGLPPQDQGEAAAIDRRGRIHLSSEGVRRPVLRLVLPEKLDRVVGGLEPDPEADRPDGPDGPDGADAAAAAGPGQAAWPWALTGGMALVVLYGAVRLVRAGFFGEE